MSAVKKEVLDLSTPEGRIEAFIHYLNSTTDNSQMDSQSLLTATQILYLRFNYLFEEKDLPPKWVIKEEMEKAVRRFYKNGKSN